MTNRLSDDVPRGHPRHADELDAAQIWPHDHSHELLAHLRQEYPGYSDEELYCIWQRDTNQVLLDRHGVYADDPKGWKEHVYYLKKLALQEGDLEITVAHMTAAAAARPGQAKLIGKPRTLSVEAIRRRACDQIYRILKSNPGVSVNTLCSYAEQHPDRLQVFVDAGIIDQTRETEA